jgi:hypothetical protein
MSSESLCALWCWTHKRMRLHVLCVIRQALLDRVTACVSHTENTTKFCGSGKSRMHYLGHCCQTTILHCTACCAVQCKLNWVWGACCLGVRWLFAHPVYLHFSIRCLIHNIYDRYYIYKRYYLPDITDERLTTSTLSIARTSCLFMNLKNMGLCRCFHFYFENCIT